MSDDYGAAKGRVPERDDKALLGRLRCAIHAGFRYTTWALNTYLEQCTAEERKKLHAEAGGQLSNLKRWLDDEIPLKDEDHWQNGGPIARIQDERDGRRPGVWLVVCGVPTKLFLWADTPDPRTSMLKGEAEVRDKATKLCRSINEAAAEGRQRDGFRY